MAGFKTSKASNVILQIIIACSIRMDHRETVNEAVFSSPESAFAELLCSTVVFCFYLIIIV
jgi:hypothetical protein